MNVEKLRLLLAEGHESEQLDYKVACNLAEARDTVELAKDVGAMQVLGGFVVIGADEHGMPSGGQFTATHGKLFDEATLRTKMLRYLDPPLELLSASHVIDGDHFAVIYVGPNPKGMAIFKADGNYAGGSAFRAGDVFVRRGTASVRWQQTDLDRIYGQAISRLKEEWRREIAEALGQQVDEGRRAQVLATGPAEVLDWRLDADTFTRVATEQLRANDDIPLRLALDKMLIDAVAFESVGAHEELRVVLDRLACMAALFISLDRQMWLEAALDVFLRIYEAPMQPSPVTRQGSEPMLWLSVSERLVAIGGLAVRRRNWAAVRSIALLRTPGREQYLSYLLRHTVTSAGRGGLLQARGGQAVQLVSLGVAVARRLDCVRPDCGADDERLLNSACQFDALAALAAMGESQTLDTKVFYTSFAYYYPHRTEPAIARLLSDPGMRSALFPGDDASLAEALANLNHWASSEGLRYSGWHGFEDRVVIQFIRAHLPPDSRARFEGT